MVEWRDWGAFSAGTLGTKPMIVGANSITLEEVVDEAALLLYRSAPITIEDQIPVFTEWVENALKQSMPLQKNNYSKKHWS
jgi:hypothetical protein